MNVNQRSRTYTWEDPIALRDAGATMSGLDYLNAVFGGKLPPPPIAQTVGFTGAEVEEGKAVFTAEPGEFLYNPIGVVHGGFAMTILDSAMGCAVRQSFIHIDLTYRDSEDVPTRIEVGGSVRPVITGTLLA